MELKKDAPATLPGKIYALTQDEQKALSKTSSKSTFRKATYTHPKALTPPPSSSLKKRTDDCDQSKITDD
jgi:hypothetical protein